MPVDCECFAVPVEFSSWAYIEDFEQGTEVLRRGFHEYTSWMNVGDTWSLQRLVPPRTLQGLDDGSLRISDWLNGWKPSSFMLFSISENWVVEFQFDREDQSSLEPFCMLAYLPLILWAKDDGSTGFLTHTRPFSTTSWPNWTRWWISRSTRSRTLSRKRT